MSDNQCWFGKWSPTTDRCTEPGTYGLSAARADKELAPKYGILRLARWCKKHAHYDDVYLGDTDEKTTTGPAAAPPTTS